MTNHINKLATLDTSQAILNVHRTKLKDYQNQFKKSIKKEEEIRDRLELLNPFVDNNEKNETKRLDTLMTERVSLSYTHDLAEDFLEYFFFIFIPFTY